MARKSMLKMTLGDGRHWVGWVITTVAIIGIFYLLGVNDLYVPWYHVIYLFLTVMIIDIIKHYAKLQ